MSNPGSVSLEKAIRTCKVNTAWANRVESDRIFNPNNMMCPVWNGRDLAGREVCPDSFYTKRAGCNSAEDRVLVENNVSRPQYMEYITLSANGIRGNVYKPTAHGVSAVASAQNAVHQRDVAQSRTGGFGLVGGGDGTIEAQSHIDPYSVSAAETAQNHTDHRHKESFIHGSNAYNNRRMSGF